MKRKKLPMQPIELVRDVLRFRKNTLVCHLLDNGGIDMNMLARVECPPEERDQFLQLIGYSVSGAPLTTKRARKKRDELQEAWERSDEFDAWLLRHRASGGRNDGERGG
jgi:hypothetical protein